MVDPSHAEGNDIVLATISHDIERRISQDKPEMEQLETSLSPSSNPLPMWKSLKANDGDTALALFDNVEQLHEVVDPVAEKKLVRKIDLAILPCLAVCYTFYYASSSLHRPMLSC